MRRKISTSDSMAPLHPDCRHVSSVSSASSAGQAMEQQSPRVSPKVNARVQSDCLSDGPVRERPELQRRRRQWSERWTIMQVNERSVHLSYGFCSLIWSLRLLVASESLGGAVRAEHIKFTTVMTCATSLVTSVNGLLKYCKSVTCLMNLVI